MPLKRIDRERFASVSRSLDRAYRWGRESGTSWLREFGWQWAGIVAALSGMLLLFAKIGEDVFEHESGTFDAVVRDWFLGHQTPLGVRFFTAVTLSGGSVSMLVLAIVVSAWLWGARRRHVAPAVVSAATISIAAFGAIKWAFGRTRPIGAAAFLHRVTYSFPSGHSTASAAVLGTIAYVLWRERLADGGVVGVIAAIAAFLIGLSRLYLDLHWATDVLGGWCLGLGVATVAAALYERWRPREANAIAGQCPTVRAPDSPC